MNRKKNHNKTVMLVGSKLNSIESKNEIGHESFMIIINGKINVVN